MNTLGCKSVISKVRDSIQNFRTCQSGGMTVPIVLMFVTLILCVGAAIDVAKVMQQKALLQSAVDASALAAGSKYGEGQTKKKQLLKTADDYFTTNQDIASRQYKLISLDLDIKNSPNVEIKVDVTANVKLMIGSMIGKSEYKIAASSTVATSGLKYIQFVFLIDNSNSMSLPGTDADLSKWQANNGGCAFACHDSVELANTGSHGMMRAKNLGIKLKMDFVREAMNNFADAAKTKLNAKTTDVAYSIHTVGTRFDTLLNDSTKLSDFESRLSSVEVEPSFTTIGKEIGPEAGDGWSYLSQGMEELEESIDDIGNGSSSKKRKTYVIFVTDGLDSYPISRTFGPRYEPQCADLKKEGAELFTIQTYYPPSTDVGIVNAFKKIPAALKACASGDKNYFMAEEGPAILAAFEQIFESAAKENLRISQ